MLLLDSQTWVWSVEGLTRHIGRRTRRRLSSAERQDAIRISAASVFEVTALHTSGRLRLAQPVEQWIRNALDRPGVRLVELTPDIAVDAGSIPRTALPGPMDRLLVATARQLDATFVTSDVPILEYAATTGAVRMYDARL